MPKITIDNQAIDVPAGATVLTAARQAGISIPTLCYLDGFEHVTSCMVCVVLNQATGDLIPACSALAEEGMQIDTHAPAVADARRVALELLLSEHLGDCEAPCQRACPALMNIPVMIRHLARGELAEAIAVVKQEIALPAVLGRICAAPCEKACRRGQHDSPLAIKFLKRFVADCDLASKTPYRPQLAPASGKQVAIVGAGPAGLAAAYHLLRQGHACTIFEQQSLPGGGLQYGVPEDELPRNLLQAEIQQIVGLGAELKLNCQVGRDVEMSALTADFDAVVLGVGAIDREHAGNGFGVEFRERGIQTERKTHQTSVPGVFAGGAAVAPGHMAVRAVGHGREIAIAVDQWLRGGEVTGRVRSFNSRMSQLSPSDLATFAEAADDIPRQAPHAEESCEMTADSAAAEAGRCLHCDCRKPHSCKLRCYADEYRANARRYQGAEQRQFRPLADAEIVYEPGKCIACGICVRVTRLHQEPLGLTYIGRGFDVRVGVPFNEPLSKGLTAAATECVKACPTGALAFGDQEDQA